MYIRKYYIEAQYTRTSKLGNEHQYTRVQTMCVFRCDNCNAEFERPRGSMDPKRISNNYFHVCSACDAKKFAQQRGVVRKRIWDMPASSGLDISKL